MKISNIDILIKKSNRKTLSIYIERDGSVCALVPEKLTNEKVQEILETKEYQIHRNLAKWKQLNERHVLREFVNGQGFLYLGRNYRLKLVDEILGQIHFTKGRFLLSKHELDNAKKYFIEFYRNKLYEKLKPIVNRYQSEMGVKSNKIKVMELKNRWASCSVKGNINFNWKCAMAPTEVIHYIVVHELVHLTHMNHTSAFWNEVDKVIPNYEKQVEWLKENGSGMDL